ncbi:MAG: endo-1,4-beta-xylanase [Candidatus Saccharibacteria bacterium]
MGTTKKSVAIILKALCSVVAVGLICVLVYNPDPYANKPTPQLPSPALKTLADDRGIQIGNFASLKYLKEQAYRDITVSQFNYAIVDGEPNWRFETSKLRPTIDTFDFTDMDKVFDFAKQNNMPVVSNI